MTVKSNGARGHGWDGDPLLRPAGVDAAGSGRLAADIGASVGAVRGGFAALRLWRERTHQRRRLASLDERLLKDIGLTRADIDDEDEVRKPFWQP